MPQNRGLLLRMQRIRTATDKFRAQGEAAAAPERGWPARALDTLC
jgi:hypothetical protein